MPISFDPSQRPPKRLQDPKCAPHLCAASWKTEAPPTPPEDPRDAEGGEHVVGMTNVEHTTSKNARQRLPNRRPAYTEALDADGQALVATVGFDPKSGQPRELFLTVGKEGSLLNQDAPDARAGRSSEDDRCHPMFIVSRL